VRSFGSLAAELPAKQGAEHVEPAPGKTRTDEQVYHLVATHLVGVARLPTAPWLTRVVDDLDGGWVRSLVVPVHIYR
jgi:hypothetical protein